MAAPCRGRGRRPTGQDRGLRRGLDVSELPGPPCHLQVPPPQQIRVSRTRDGCGRWRAESALDACPKQAAAPRLASISRAGNISGPVATASGVARGFRDFRSGRLTDGYVVDLNPKKHFCCAGVLRLPDSEQMRAGPVLGVGAFPKGGAEMPATPARGGGGGGAGRGLRAVP